MPIEVGHTWRGGEDSCLAPVLGLLHPSHFDHSSKTRIIRIHVLLLLVLADSSSPFYAFFLNKNNRDSCLAPTLGLLHPPHFDHSSKTRIIGMQGFELCMFNFTPSPRNDLFKIVTQETLKFAYLL